MDELNKMLNETKEFLALYDGKIPKDNPLYNLVEAFKKAVNRYEQKQMMEEYDMD